MPSDPAEAARAVLSALGAGRLTPGQAHATMEVVASLARIIEAGELENRVQKIQVSVGGGPDWSTLIRLPDNGRDTPKPGLGVEIYPVPPA